MEPDQNLHDDFPSTTPKGLSPQQSADAAATARGIEIASEQRRQATDSRDISDPSEPSSTPTGTPAAPEPKARAPISGASVLPSITPAVLARAASHGIMAADAEKYGDRLNDVLELLDRRAYQSPAPQPAAQPIPAKPAEVEDPYAGIPELTEDPESPWAPEFKAWVEGVRQFMAEQRQENKGKFQQHTQILQQQKVHEENRWADSKFNEMPDDLAPIFGKGTYQNIQPNSPHFRERAKVFGMTAHLVNTQGMDRDEAFEAAMRAFHPTYESPKQAQTREVNQLRDHQGRFLTPPTRRKPAPGSTLDTDTPPVGDAARAEWEKQRFIKGMEAAGYRNN